MRRGAHATDTTHKRDRSGLARAAVRWGLTGTGGAQRGLAPPVSLVEASLTGQPRWEDAVTVTHACRRLYDAGEFNDLELA
jgi:hypothetical protein